LTTRKELEIMKAAQKIYEWPYEAVVPGAILKGISASHGAAKGPATVITDQKDLHRIKPDTVLVCPHLSPDLTAVFPLIIAVVADHGSTLASAAIIAREYGIPTVVGVETATEAIHDGDITRVDGTMGLVEILSSAQQRKD
jgi:pyruvate,water dikinase